MDTLPTEHTSSKTESIIKEDGISISIPIETPKCLEFVTLQSNLKESIDKVIEERNIQIENLTRAQAVDAFFQAMMAGDLTRYIMFNPDKQTVVYIPGQGVDQLRTENYALRDKLNKLRFLITEAQPMDAIEFERQLISILDN